MKIITPSLILILALAFSVVAGTLFVNLAYAQSSETITIKADGSIEPSTAAIHRVGDFYLLTGDVGPISVKRSNITLDGRGHTIQGEISQTSNSNIGGISLRNVQNVTVKGFSIKNCSFGFSLDYCSNITISGNNITRTWQPLPFGKLPAGIFIWDGDYNIITGNRFENNSYGMYFAEHSEHSVIVGNTISGSTHEGIRLFDSSSNTFYHNNFDNTQNVYDSGLDHYDYLSINAWDDGEEGNFWSDYNGTDADGNGIGDTPYNVESLNQDRYPLMKPWDPAIPFDTVPPRISIISPVHKVYNESIVSLSFLVNEASSSMSYSLDGQDNVTTAGNTTLSELPNGAHSITFYATDKAGNTGASDTIYFTVSEPFPTTLVVASVTSVAVICLGLLVYFKKRKR
jgi:parallel beta-helix repeat protein